MIAAVGNKVEALHRHQVGQLVLLNLKMVNGFIYLNNKTACSKYHLRKQWKVWNSLSRINPICSYKR